MTTQLKLICAVSASIGEKTCCFPSAVLGSMVGAQWHLRCHLAAPADPLEWCSTAAKQRCTHHCRPYSSAALVKHTFCCPTLSFLYLIHSCAILVATCNNRIQEWPGHAWLKVLAVVRDLCHPVLMPAMCRGHFTSGAFKVQKLD